MSDKVQMLVEKERHFIPRTARELMGFPIEYEWKEVSVEEAVMRSELIMPDGRPMSAWWFEIQAARERKPDSEKRERNLRERFLLLRIAEWATATEAITGDVIIRFRPTLATPEEIASNPGVHCERVRP